MYDFKREVLAAGSRIRPFVKETPLDYSVALSHQTNCDVYLKCENLQHTGAFKVRGALNKLLLLTAEQRGRGVVTASSGNHAAAVAYGLGQLHMPGIIFLPEGTPPVKVEKIRNYGVPIEFYSHQLSSPESFAMEYARRHKMVYISPYNDFHVITGQGTIANEMTYQQAQLNAIFVPVGGGGLISGIAGFLKTVSPKIKIIGCLPERSPVMARSVQSGAIQNVSIQPTLSDATAGAIEPGSMTLEFCKQYVDDFVLVSENEIAEAILFALQTHHALIEGAAALTLAAFLKKSKYFFHQTVGLVLTGANITLPTLKLLLD